MTLKKKTIEVQKKKEFSLTSKLKFTPLVNNDMPKNRYQDQNLLRTLLREFGLGQYLRVKC